MSEQGTTKEEKLLIELRGWYTLKGADCFRQAAEEIQRLREDLRRTESAHAIVMAENRHYKQVAAELAEAQPQPGQCMPLFDRVTRSGTCTACGKHFACGAALGSALPPGDGQ